MQRITQVTDQDLARPALQADSVRQTVSHIIDAVRTQGDAALINYAHQFDQAQISQVLLPREQWELAASYVSASLKAAIESAKDHIIRFHEAQRPKDERVETEPGVTCWRKSVPLQRVGLYIPGGNAPLFSTVLMLAIPASLAGCQEIVLATPPQRDGTIHPAILYSALISGVTTILVSGGAQAIAALAYGTQSLLPVDKIFGPGNRFVTEAKQQVAASRCAIDMPAGPSEVMVVIDHSSDPVFAAADMLSQAEHGPDSHAILVICAPDNRFGNALADAVEVEITAQLSTLKHPEHAMASLEHAKIILVTSEDEATQIINRYAPEHLIIATDHPEAVADHVLHAGSVFLGPYSCESMGDYASGTNHTLPTAGWARSYSGVSLDSFFRKITFQHITAQGIRSLGPVVETLATAESLEAHATAVSVRLASLQKEKL
jgi:histidinol dehydrogenase